MVISTKKRLPHISDPHLRIIRLVLGFILSQVLVEPQEPSVDTFVGWCMTDRSGCTSFVSKRLETRVPNGFDKLGNALVTCPKNEQPSWLAHVQSPQMPNMSHLMSGKSTVEEKFAKGLVLLFL